MNHHFLKKSGSDELLLFFNGWGLDSAPFAHLSADSLDVVIFDDYTTPECELDLAELCDRYEMVSLAAWSLGVWACAEFFEGRAVALASAVAINGPLAPISAEYGIAPDYFDGTIDGWDERNRKKFNRRMCRGGETFDFFNAHAPDRTVVAQKTELIALRQRILAAGSIGAGLFDSAVVASGDRIFTPQGQLAFWKKTGVPVRDVDAPHYLFDQLGSWREVADLGNG
jgi:biotin synthesis protein BioG